MKIGGFKEMGVFVWRVCVCIYMYDFELYVFRCVHRSLGTLYTVVYGRTERAVGRSRGFAKPCVGMGRRRVSWSWEEVGRMVGNDHSMKFREGIGV